MLIVEIILFLLFVICLITAKEMYQMSVTLKASENWQSREIQSKKLWKTSMTMTITATVILGLMTFILLVDGLRGGMVFKQVSSILVVALTYPNGKSEEREIFTETDYMFYAPKDLFYGLNRD